MSSPILSIRISFGGASGEDPVAKLEGKLTWFSKPGPVFDH